MRTTNPWESQILAFSPSFIVHQINDKPLRFWPISVGLAFELRAIAEPLAKAVTVLFSKNDQDVTTQHVSVPDKDTNKVNQQATIQGIDPSLARLRSEQQDTAIQKLISAITSPESSTVIGKIIQESLHDIFDPSERSNWPPASEFLSQLPLPLLSSMLIGVALANQGVLGPLTEKIRGTVAARIGKVVAADTNTPTPETQRIDG